MSLYCKCGNKIVYVKGKKMRRGGEFMCDICLGIISQIKWTWYTSGYREEKGKDKVMENRIIRALKRTWGNIEGDIATANGGGDLSRDLVMEMVIESNYLELYGSDKIAVEEFRKMTNLDQDRILIDTFPNETY